MRTLHVTLLYVLFITASVGTGAGADEKTDVEKELKKFQGAWTFKSIQAGGKDEPPAEFKRITVTFEGDKYTVRQGNEVIQVAKHKLDPSKSPKTVDVTVVEGENKGTVLCGIYEISGDTLKVCFDPKGKKRPTEFKTAPGTETTLFVYKRAKGPAHAASSNRLGCVQVGLRGSLTISSSSGPSEPGRFTRSLTGYISIRSAGYGARRGRSAAGRVSFGSSHAANRSSVTMAGMRS